MLRLSAVTAAVGVTLFAQLTDEQLARVEKLEEALLAPCCYSESIARHRSEAALQMKTEIRRMVAEGKADREILDVYKERYGLKVLVEPEGGLWWWMHAVPVAVIVLGLAAAVFVLRNWLKPLPAPPA